MGKELTDDDIRAAARMLRCDTAGIRAISRVESSGSGFLKDGKLRVLFEGHQFYRYTNGAYAQSHPTICYPRWTSQFYCRGNAEGRGQCEWNRLQQAIALDRKAALMSASVGRFQIMGFNFALCGFTDVEDFWTALAESEGEHLKAFCAYVIAVRLDEELREHRWADFARRYNGPGYLKNRYDTKLALAYASSLTINA